MADRHYIEQHKIKNVCDAIVHLLIKTVHLVHRTPRLMFIFFFLFFALCDCKAKPGHSPFRIEKRTQQKDKEQLGE